MQSTSESLRRTNLFINERLTKRNDNMPDNKNMAKLVQHGQATVIHMKANGSADVARIHHFAKQMDLS